MYVALFKAQDAGQNSPSCSGYGYCWILQRVGQPFRTWLRFNGF